MYREQVLLLRGFILDVAFLGEGSWKLSLRKGGKLLVEYSSSGDYEVKSVEKLRYDFERDVERALRQG
jgi:hypothetical protein